MCNKILRFVNKIDACSLLCHIASTIGHDQDLIGFCLEISSRYRELSSTGSNFYCMDKQASHNNNSCTFKYIDDDFKRCKI